MILPYIIKSALTLALLYTCIMPLLEKETFHRLNRMIVLGCLLLSFIIPLIHFTGGTNQTIDMVRQAVQLPEILIDGNANKQTVWSLTDILICIYKLVLLISINKNYFTNMKENIEISRSSILKLFPVAGTFSHPMAVSSRIVT